MQSGLNISYSLHNEVDASSIHKSGSFSCAFNKNDSDHKKEQNLQVMYKAVEKLMEEAMSAYKESMKLPTPVKCDAKKCKK